MFSSPKGISTHLSICTATGLTVSIILNDYLRVSRTKLEAYLDSKTHESISPTATAVENCSTQEIEKLKNRSLK